MATALIQVASVASDGSAIAGGAGTPANYTFSATVTGNQSNAASEHIHSRHHNELRGIRIGELGAGDCAYEYRGGGTTTASIAYGTASNTTTLAMSFDSTPVTGVGTGPTPPAGMDHGERHSDIDRDQPDWHRSR